jgi:MFS family permease
VLFVVMLLNFLDRQIISILGEHIKRDLALANWQLGALSGLSFALLYTTLGVPIALLADRWHRPRIIAVSLAVWSLFTVLCGAAQNFVQILLARVGVGVGEAGSGPASHSLMADLFPPDKRAGAMGVYGMAVPLGAFFAYAGGGFMMQYFDWRQALILAGLPGLLVAVVVWFTIREPRAVVPLKEALRPRAGQLSFREAIGELARKPTYWRLIGAGVMVQFVAYGFAAFYGSYFIRSHGVGAPGAAWDFTTMGVALGTMVGLAGGFGAFFGGYVADRIRHLGVGWTLIVPGLIMVASTPLMALGLNQPDPLTAVIFFAAPTLAGTFYYGPTFAAIQSLARNETRAVAVAIYLLISGLAGMGLGPLFVGTLNDILKGIAVAGGATEAAANAQGLVQALAVLSAFNIVGGLLFFHAARSLKADQVG